ncbi:MAG: VOC family protein [Gammaproteobacteria bacterium]
MLKSISHIALTVNDPARTAKLFQELFDARVLERKDDEGHLETFTRLGGIWVVLVAANVERARTRVDGKHCAVRWTVVSIDPVSMTLKAELRQHDHSGFGDVSVALPIGRTLWLGDFDGHSILIEPDKLLTASNR